MKVKIDKEFIIKHHFWILLGIYAPLVLVSLAMLWTSVADAIEEKRKAIAAVKGNIESIIKDTNIRNPAWLEAGTQKEKGLAVQKDKVWEVVWKGQAGMVTWPKFMLDKYPDLKNKDFGEPLADSAIRDQFINDRDEQGYQQMLADVVQTVQPILFPEDVQDLRSLRQARGKAGEGVVQFKGGWAKVLQHVRKWVDPSAAKSIPTSEEVWLALEDLWVQRELLQAVRDANDFLAVFRKTSDSPKPDATKGEIARQTFITPRWRLELIMTRDKVLWQLTNVGVRQQTLGHTFRVKLLPEGSKPLDLFVDGEPLTPHQSTPWAPAKVDNKEFNPLGFKGFDSVEQAINWRTAPVKRIDRVALVTRSARTQQFDLKPPPVLEEKKEAALPGTGGLGAGGPGAAGPGGAGAAAPGGGGGGGGAVAAKGDQGGIDKNRYIDVTTQVRRMPLGIVVIVDQAHVQDVLTAIANSRLRVQITQTQLQRFRGSINPGFNDTPTPTAPVGKPVGGAPPVAAGLPAGGNTVSKDTGGDDEAANLVELSIYGTASLYQKCPDKPAEAGDGPGAAQPGVAPAPKPPQLPKGK